MTQPSRWGFARLARLATTVGSVVLFGAGSLAAQGTTGKIEGTVRDQAGAPVAGAQVLIVGSAFASATNERGYYFINNVPAGTMTVRAQFIGYAPNETRNVRVFAGGTFTVNIVLEQRAIEVDAITVSANQNAIVPRDQVTSKPTVAGELIQSLPADNVSQVLRLQPGVVESARGLSIRGGRVGEAAIYVDGVPVRSLSGNTGVGTSGVGTNSLEEASITTGAIGATQGDAQSGIISLVTRSGGQKFTGYLSLATDEIAGETYGQGLNRMEASVSGPLAKNLTFFLSTTMQGQQSPRRGVGAEDQPIYVLNGTDTTVLIASTPGNANSDSIQVALPAFTRYSSGQRRPDDWSSIWNVDGKVTYSYGTGSRISATIHNTVSQGLNFRGGNVFNPMAQTGFRNNSQSFIVNWSQNLARSSERALFLDANFSYQSDQSQGGLVDQAWYNDHRSPGGNFTLSSMPFVTSLDNFPIDDRLIQNIRVNNCQNGRDAARPNMGGCIPMVNRNDLGQAAPYRTNPYGVSSGGSYFPSTGTGNQAVGLASETRFTGRANLDWQLDRYNRVQVGGDFVSANSKNFNSGLTSQIFMDAAIYKPSRFGLYATDRLDLGDVVIDLGLRYDHLNPGVKYSNSPGRLYTDPVRNGDLTKSFTAADTVLANQCSAMLAAADTLGWSTCNMFDGASRGIVLPSIRVSFPVTDRTGFRLSYAQQAQTPDFNLLATGVNTDLAISNTNDIFGRDLTYGKTILFEFGVRHAFSQDMVLDIAAYNKDKVSDVTGRIVPVFDPFKAEIQNINLYTNADFGNVRGVDVKLDRRVGSLFQGSLAYTFEAARSTGSDPNEYLNTTSRQISNVTNDRLPPPQALLTTRDNRTHTIAGSLALNFPQGWRSGTTAGTILENFGAFATFRFASGLAYTRVVNAGGGTRGPGNGFGLISTGLEQLNSSTMPWIKNVDLRLTRGFRLGGARDLTVFADFRNLFNWTNLTAIFAETGDVVNNLFETNTIDPVKVTLQNEAGSLVRTRTVTQANGSTANETGVDLGDCSRYQPTLAAGVPNCIMLRRAEARYGDGDQFFTDAEQNAAYGAWYRLNNAPYALKGAGLNFRLGFEFNF
jgi:hypothetical protein